MRIIDEITTPYQNKLRMKNVLVAILIGLAVIVVMHLVLLNALSMAEVRRDMLSDARVGARITSEKLQIYKELASQGATELSTAHKLPSAKLMLTLCNYEMSDKFARAYYIDLEGNRYLENGQMIPLPDDTVKKLDERQDAEGIQVYADFIGTDTASVITVVAPIISHAELRGYFAGDFTFADSYYTDVVKYMELDSNFYLVDESGAVIVQNDVDAEDEFSNVKNLISFADGLSGADNKQLRDAINSENGGYTRFWSEDLQYEVAYEPVPLTTDWTYMCLNKRASYLGLFISQRKGEISVIVIDIILIFISCLTTYLIGYVRHRKIQRIAFDDGITSANTKEYFRYYAKKLIGEGKKKSLVVMAIDIIDFRYVNELFGHERGDEILMILARLLQEHMGEGAVVARNTADLFEILLTSEVGIESKFLNVADGLSEYAKSIDVTMPLYIRAGYCPVLATDKDINSLLDKANAARKSLSKESPTLCVEYSSGIQTSLRIQEEIESSKENALKHGEFKVFLQPKFDVFTGKLAGAEALIRWIRMDGSMVFPDQFIPLFESNGFIEKVDFYMLEQVCKLQQDLQERGYNRVPISVNQSRVLLLNPEYVNSVMTILNKYSMTRSLIELEVTETCFFDDKNKMIQVLGKLQDEECKIDIDDFGSGYSSLNMLKDIPFNVLKIDREFFGESVTGFGKIILKKIVEMASELNAECICEGVETAEHEELLREIGCRYAQGYYYSKPIPAEEFVQKFMEKL